MSARSTPSRGGANPSFSLGKEEVDKVGQALISKAVTSKQLDALRQYDDDSSAVGSSLEAMDGALDDLSNDVKELGRCLKSSAFATAQLQKVQKRINGQIKDMLRREKAKLEIKEKSILSLDSKLRKIEKNQNKIIFGYRWHNGMVSATACSHVSKNLPKVTPCDACAIALASAGFRRAQILSRYPNAQHLRPNVAALSIRSPGFRGMS